MLSSSSVGKKESHCSAKLCTPVWFSSDSKGHLQARKKGKAEKLREIAINCEKLGNCGKLWKIAKLRKIAENCEIAENWGKLRTSIPPPPEICRHPSGPVSGRVPVQLAAVLQTRVQIPVSSTNLLQPPV